MVIKGYKSFNLNQTNAVGIPFEEGKSYHIDGPISFGTKGNGYHFAKRMEDTLRYSGEGLVRDILIAEVVGYGDIAEGSDEYYGYYELYSCSDIYIEHFLTRDEVLMIAKNLPLDRMLRFITLYRLQETEYALFEGRSGDIDLAMDYYQRGNKDAYEKEHRLRKYNKYINTHNINGD